MNQQPARRRTGVSQSRAWFGFVASSVLAAILVAGCASNGDVRASATTRSATSTTAAAHRKSTAFLFGSPRKKVTCHATAKQQAAADKLLADTKRGLARLADLKRAESEGYTRFGDVPIIGTWHYIDWTYAADNHILDPTRPESIIYWKANVSARPILIGAMYIMPRAGVIGPQIGGCLTVWHVHGPPFAPAGQVTNEMLHVWLIPMPDGPFA